MADEAILLYSLRYALGRRTYAPGDVQQAIRAAMPLRDSSIRHAMIEDIEQAERQALVPATRYALGDVNIDAPGWLALLADLRKEREAWSLYPKASGQSDETVPTPVARLREESL